MLDGIKQLHDQIFDWIIQYRREVLNETQAPIKLAVISRRWAKTVKNRTGGKTMQEFLAGDDRLMLRMLGANGGVCVNVRMVSKEETKKMVDLFMEGYEEEVQK